MNLLPGVALPVAAPSTPSRRDLVRGLAGLGLGFGVVGCPSWGKGKRRKRRNTVTIKRNTFGCVNVGYACKRSGQCCSGICTGKQGKKRCRAHGESTCPRGQDACAGVPFACATSTGDPGVCLLTTGEASYCQGLASECMACRRDADCVPFCGPEAACVVCQTCFPEGLQTGCAGPSPESCTFPPRGRSSHDRPDV
jgi:hypothetical protein